MWTFVWAHPVDYGLADQCFGDPINVTDVTCADGEMRPVGECTLCGKVREVVPCLTTREGK